MERRLTIGSDAFDEMFAGVQRAMRLTHLLNSLPPDDTDAIRSVLEQLFGQPVDPTLRLLPPFSTDHGLNIEFGRNDFVNQGCMFMDYGGIRIGDRVMIGPRVSLITVGHPVEHAERRQFITCEPITIHDSAWIGASATILPGVTIGAKAVIAAGAVVTKDVPESCLAAGVPARVVRQLNATDEPSLPDT